LQTRATKYSERPPFALLLTAHGERRDDAENVSVARLAQNLAAAGVATEVGFGFIKGSPTVNNAIRALSLPHIIVYPLFLADGYFTRVALPRLIEQAKRQDQIITVLAPLGLDPALGDLIVDETLDAARCHSILPEEVTVVLVAHGSTSDKASRIATEQLADRVRERRCFRDTRFALLEEAPSLAEATADTRGPIIVVGLFAGEGVHGADDTKRLVAELGRDDIVLVGPVGTFGGIDAVIAAAVIRHGTTKTR
jgi:sirohydrochlorin ferrochelatase